MGSISRQTVRNYFNINCNIQGLTIEHGEMVAIAKSIWQFRNTSQNVRIYSDCLNALKKINDVIPMINRTSITRNKNNWPVNRKTNPSKTLIKSQTAIKPDA